MLLGTEKAGKSILAQQMAFALTSGEPFLEHNEVPEPCAVFYLQTEGKDAEMARRIEVMANALKVNRELYYRAYKKFLPLDVLEFRDELIALIRAQNPLPKVMFIDSLYTTCVGDLSDNKDMRTLMAEISYLADMFGMAVVIIHHEIKTGFVQGEDNKMREVKTGDNRSYGSVFLRAFCEHILYLQRTGGKRSMGRSLSCETTRTGLVLEEQRLELVQPDPLYFKPVNNPNVSESHV